MRIVSENSDEEIAARKAREKVRRALRALTASLLRTMRGAGDPENLEIHAAAFLDAASAYRDLVYDGMAVEDIRADLAIEGEDAGGAIWTARESIISAALRISAARLVDEFTQERLGSNDLSQSLLEWKQAVQMAREGER